MNSPIFVVAGATLLIFETLDRAESYMEPIDVENGEYDAVYDSEGHLLNFEVRYVEEEVRFLWFAWQMEREKTVITDHEPPIIRASELRDRLRTYLARLGRYPEDWLRQAALDELVSTAYSTQFKRARSFDIVE